MRSVTSIIIAMGCLACYVAADCCDMPCADGTAGTPCCGNGKCNVFCCNCDNGCRKENYAQCFNYAENDYDTCLDAMNIGQGTYDDCLANLANAKTSCGWQFLNKRSAPFVRRDASNDDDRTFSEVDQDGSGNITLDQYVQFMQGKNPAMQQVLPSQEDWAAWFNKFDANGDGGVDVEEHRRAS